MNKKVCGIYKITNKINGKSYIGQSTNIFYRWKQHKNNIHKKGFDYALYHAFRKYGLENFSWEIIEICTKDKLDELERHYIEYFNTYVNLENAKGYNMTLGGIGGLGGYTRRVSQYGLDGAFIATYSSVTEASNQTNIGVPQIILCCSKQRNHAGNFIWRYAEDKPPKPYRGRGKIVWQYDLQGNFLKSFNNANTAAKEVGCHLGQISNCCKGLYKSAGGYMWTYENEPPPSEYFVYDAYYIYQYSKDGEFLHQYKTPKEAAEAVGVTRTAIIQCYTGQTQTSGGFIWEKVSL